MNSLQTSSTRPSFISGNTITNGRLYLFLNYAYCDLTVEHNTIEGSSRGGMYVRNYYGSTHVRNNTIAACTATSSSIVQLEGYNNVLRFQENAVRNNQGYRIFDLFGASNFASSSYVFSANVAHENVGTNSLIYLSQYPWTSFDSNIFFDNDSPISVELNMPGYQEEFISLPSNYWGNFQPDIVDLRETVVDAFVLTSGPIVDFDPLLNGTSVDR